MMNFSSILIVTYGRSGSTLLQGLLNSIDDCLILGENYNFCYGLFSAYEALVKTKQIYGQSSRTAEDPWYGANLFNENIFLEDTRKLVFNQLNPDKLALSCIGFKEIRYVDTHFNPDKLHDYLNFLEKVFPNPAFIILTRDHDQVMKSGWWRSMDSKKTEAQLDKFEKDILAYSTNKANTFFIDYCDLVERSQNLVSMFQFLGAPYNSTSIEKVLLTKHSWEPKSVKDTQNYTIHIEQTQHHFIQHAEIDNLPLTHLNNITVTGVIVLSSNIDNNYNLIAIDAESEHKIAWNISSPVIAQKFSDNQYAKNARFRVGNLSINKNKAINIYLKDNYDNKHLIFKIFLDT